MSDWSAHGRAVLRPLVAGGLLAVTDCSLRWSGGAAEGATSFLAGAATLAVSCALSLLLWSALSALVRLDRWRAPWGWASALILIWLAVGWFGWELSAGRTLRDHSARPSVLMFGGFLAAAASVLVARRVARIAAAARGRWAVALSLAALSVSALWADATLLRRLYPALHWGLGLTSLVAAVAAAWVAPVGRLDRLPKGVAVALLGLSACLILLAPHAVLVVRARPGLGLEMERSSPVVGKLLAALRRRQPYATQPAPPGPHPVTDAGGAALDAGSARGLDLRGESVLLVTVDALRADSLGAYGGTVGTPRMDALAAEGVIFERAVTPTPHTSYAIASLMTGTFVRELVLAGRPLPPEGLAAALSRVGYRTAALYPPGVFYVDGERLGALRDSGFGFSERYTEQQSGAARVAQAAALLDGHTGPAPLLLWVHLFEPHEPYEAIAGRPDATARERYDQEVRTVDGLVGQLVARFRRDRPRSTVILTSDHGEEFGDHGGAYHGTTLYDEQVRVPLIWSSPGRLAPRQVASPVETVDLAGTLLGALGLPPPGWMRSDDLGPALRGGDGVPWAFSSVGEQRMVTDGRYKTICLFGAPRCRLFDLMRDPGEFVDLAEARPAELARLGGALASMVASVVQGSGGRASAEEVLARARLGEPGLGRDLSNLLGDPSESLRAEAADALGGLRHGSALPTLERLRKDDPVALVRAASAIACLRIGELGCLGQVRTLTRDASLPNSVRRRAAQTLAEHDDGTGAAELAALALDSEAPLDERRAATLALGRVGGRDSVPALVTLLEHPSLSIAAAQGLGHIGGTGARRALRRALSDERYPLARAAQARALGELDRNAALRLVQRYLGHPGALPDGVLLLSAWGALDGWSARGGTLASGDQGTQGAWACDNAGCVPGPDAILTVPAQGLRAGPAVVTLRVVAEDPGSGLQVGEHRFSLRRGSQEVAFRVARAGSGARRWTVRTDGSVSIAAVAVNPAVTLEGP